MIVNFINQVLIKNGLGDKPGIFGNSDSFSNNHSLDNCDF